MASESNDIGRRNRNRSWWQQRTKLERTVIILLIITILLLLSLIIALAIVANKKKGADEELCTTTSCIEGAAKILYNMDESVQPCDNFYEFACGGYQEKTLIPSDQIETGAFTIAKEQLKQQLKKVIEIPVSPNESKPFIELKKMYNTCLNTQDIEEDGLEPILNVIKKVGGWPAVQGRAWNENNFDWKQSVYKFRKNGLNTNYFLKIQVDADLKNSSHPIIFLDQAELDISRDNLLLGLNDTLIDAYFNYMVDLAAIFGADKSFVSFEIRNMIEFQRQLANISLSDIERNDRTTLYNLMTVAELQQRYPLTPDMYWLDFFNNFIDIPEKYLTDEALVSVNVPSYLSQLGKILQGTSRRAQANHAIFQALRSLEPYLPESIRKREQEFNTIITGMSTRTPRWSECIDLIITKFEIATSALYVRNYFNEDIKKSANEMVTNLKDEFLNILKNTKWMDETTRRAAIEKATVMSSHIAYSNELLDDKTLEEYYSDLQINYNTCIDMVNDISLFNRNKQIRMLGVHINSSDWRTRLAPIEVNAVYAPQENSIHLPAVILQGVFFDKNRVQAMNYGGIGYFIGHEITHGFDNEGKKFDKNGHLVNWWANETNQAFENKAQCFVDQYSRFVVPEINLKVDGTLTEAENIADNGGIKEAYFAYNAWVRRHGEERKLPGLKYTPNQLFWISIAQCWCTKERVELLQNLITLDNHSPSRFRVIGPLQNSDQFAKDFNCPSGSFMNPKHKCQVW